MKRLLLFDIRQRLTQEIFMKFFLNANLISSKYSLLSVQGKANKKIFVMWHVLHKFIHLNENSKKTIKFKSSCDSSTYDADDDDDTAVGWESFFVFGYEYFLQL